MKGGFAVIDYLTSSSTTARDVVDVVKVRPLNRNKNLTDGVNSFKKTEIPIPDDLHD